MTIINVIETSENTVIGVRSFPADQSGRIKANAHFRSCVQENSAALPSQVVDATRRKFYKDGTYTVSIVEGLFIT